MGDALASFDGAVILCTHDRALIRKVAKQVIHIARGKASLQEGDGPTYLASLKHTKRKGAKRAG